MKKAILLALTLNPFPSTGEETGERGLTGACFNLDRPENYFSSTTLATMPAPR